MKLFATLLIVAAIICLAVAAGAVAWWLGFTVAGVALGVYGLLGVEVDE